MSILQEYQTIRRTIGEKRFQEIEDFLSEHPDLLLSDVYYKEEIWDKFEDWAYEKFGTPKTVKKADPFEEMLNDSKKENLYPSIKGKAIAFDIETTGLGTDDEILQMCIVDEDMNIVFNSYLKPERHNEWEQAQAVHHITPEMVKDAPTLNDVRENLINIFDNCERIVGYNHINFDVPFVERELDYNITKPLNDVMFMYANYVKEKGNNGTYKWQKLTHLIDNLNFDPKQYSLEGLSAHDASYDVLATMFGYNKLKDMDLSFSKQTISLGEAEPIDMPVDELLTSLENNPSLTRKFEKGKELFSEFNFNDFSLSTKDLEEGYKISYNNKYKQTIKFDKNDNVKELSCSCPDCQGGSQYCKHLIGSLLDIKERRNSIDYDSCTMDYNFIKTELAKGIDSINRMPLDYYYSSNSLETTESISYKANLLPDDFVWNTYSDGSGGLYKGKQNYASYDFRTGEYTIKTDSGKSYRYFDSMDEMMNDVENMIDKIFVNNKEYLQDKVKREVMTAQSDLKKIDTFMYRGSYGSQIPLDIINETVAKVEEYNNTGTFKELDSSKSVEENKELRKNALEFILANTPGNIKADIDSANLERQIEHLQKIEKEFLEKSKANSEIKEEKIDFTPRPNTTPKADMDKGLKK